MKNILKVFIVAILSFVLIGCGYNEEEQTPMQVDTPVIEGLVHNDTESTVRYDQFYYHTNMSTEEAWATLEIWAELEGFSNPERIATTLNFERSDLDYKLAILVYGNYDNDEFENTVQINYPKR